LFDNLPKNIKKTFAAYKVELRWNLNMKNIICINTMYHTDKMHLKQPYIFSASFWRRKKTPLKNNRNGITAL